MNNSMGPHEILKIWGDACKKANVNWYLRNVTLLLADYYHEFPEGFNCVDVVFECRSVSEIQKYLPENWERRKRRFFVDNQPVLNYIRRDITEQNYVTVSCGGYEYPATDYYKDYLSEKYGAYEKGPHEVYGFGADEQAITELKEHQKNCVEALQFLKELGDKHNLKYYLLAGSVLGAKRHGGFIPWDDDIDIGVKVENIEEFERLVKENLPEKFTLMVPAPNYPYNRMFAKICVDGRCCMDIWRLCPTKKEGILAKVKWICGRMFTKCHYSHIGAPVKQYRKYAEFICRFLNDKCIMKLARFNERVLNGCCDSYVNLYSIYSREKETIDKRWLEDEATLTFEGIEVPVVGCTEEYLTHLYGDYMQMPPLWKRYAPHSARFENYEENK